MKDWKNIAKTAGNYFLIYALVIIYMEIVLRCHISEGITRGFWFFLCFVPAQALFLTALNGFFSGRKNIIVSTVLLALLGAYYIAQLVYYNNFGSLFSASQMGMGAEAVENFGWTLGEAIKKSFLGILLFLLPALAAGICGGLRRWNPGKISIRPRLLILILSVLVWILGGQSTRLGGTGRQSAYSVYRDPLSPTDITASRLGALTSTVLEITSAHLDFFSAREGTLEVVDTSIITSMENTETDESRELEESGEPSQSQNIPPEDTESGDTESSGESSGGDPEEDPLPQWRPHIYEEIDLKQIAEQEADDEELRELALYLDSRGASETNEYTGMFEGYNLIYICAESFWTYAIDENVTPTLAEMANHGIILENYYNSFKNTTTNGEFAFDTSLWPDFSRKADAGTDVGSFAQSASCYMPMGLGDLFAEMGVEPHAFHNYYGRYYRRSLSWPNLGYECKFYKDGMDFTSSWPASDLELMEQSVDDYIDEEPFHAYYMTFSGHGPYYNNNAICQKNIGFVKETMGEGHSQEVYGYLAGNRELDKAMEYLLQRLEEAGKLDNTVIVIAGDHYPYNLSQDAANELVGHELDRNFEMYQSTCIIYNAGMEENIVTDTYCCNVDILPTILNLFGIEYDSRFMMGRDIFSDSIHKAVIYNKSFLTDLVRYNSQNGEAVWSELAEGYSDEMKEAYLNTMIDLVNSEYYASMQILDLNYFEYVWHQSGLMTDEELEAEQQRAQEVQERNESYD